MTELERWKKKHPKVYLSAEAWKSIYGLGYTKGRSEYRRMRHQALPIFDTATTAAMLEEVARRGGHPGAVAEAVLLCLRKSEDYNPGKNADPHAVDRDEYFPFGLHSFAQMVHTKSQRLVALAKRSVGGEASDPNFESARDTCLDLINYAGFCADWLTRHERDAP